MRPVRRAVPIALTAVIALVITACGTAEKTAPPAPRSADYPVTVHTGTGTVTVPARPRRIVSLSPAATEMLYAVGAGSQVAAVDQLSDYPDQAPRTKLSGYQPNAEAVINYSPDLVVLSDDIGGIVKALTKVKIPVIRTPAASTLSDSYDEITQLGVATGHRSVAAQVVGTMKQEIARVVSTTQKPARPLSYYYELDNNHYTATSATFIGQIFTKFGLRNIADKADRQGTGYPKLSAEDIVQASPDLIFLADGKCCKITPATVAHRPGWDHIRAVRQHDVVSLDADIASRWGPRVVDLAKAVAAAVTRAQAHAAAPVG